MPEPAERLYRVACGAMFVFGMVLALPGTVIGLPEFADQLQLSLTARGTLISVMFGGLFAGSLLSGPIIERLGQRETLTASAAALAVVLPLFAMSHSYGLALMAIAAVGLASAGVNTASNALSSDLFPHERGRRMNGIALSVGLGGLALPAGMAIAEGVVSWRWVVGGGAVAAAAAAGAGWRSTPLVPRVLERDTRGQSLRRLPGLGWLCALVACGGATESSMAGWTSIYLSRSGFTASEATWGLSSHWLGLVAGRMLLAGRVDRSKRAAIVTGALTGSMLMLLFVGVPVVPVLMAGPFAIGLAIAIVLPTSLAFGGERLPASAGALFGVLMTATQVGTIVFPPVIGRMAELFGLRLALGLLVVNGIAIALLAWHVERPRGD